MFKAVVKIPILTGLILSFFILSPGQNKDFEVQKISNGIYAFIRKEFSSLRFNQNTILLIEKRSILKNSDAYLRAIRSIKNSFLKTMFFFRQQPPLFVN